MHRKMYFSSAVSSFYEFVMFSVIMFDVVLSLAYFHFANLNQ